jgi:predicted DsbA family dithiol-disulfide isomerase
VTALSVTEFTDPMCPWAWGSEPTFRRLRELIPRARWRRAYAILFEEADDPAPDEASETAWYQRKLDGIATHTGAVYPHRLERVARTSWPATLAAKAAEAQGSAVADRVLLRLRESLFLTGRPPDTEERVLDALDGVPGLNLDLLAATARSPRTRAAVEADRALARDPLPEVLRIPDIGPHSGAAKPVQGGHRYALPTLVFAGACGTTAVGGWRPLDAYLDAADRICGASGPGNRIFLDGN